MTACLSLSIVKEMEVPVICFIFYFLKTNFKPWSPLRCPISKGHSRARYWDLDEKKRELHSGMEPILKYTERGPDFWRPTWNKQHGFTKVLNTKECFNNDTLHYQRQPSFFSCFTFLNTCQICQNKAMVTSVFSNRCQILSRWTRSTNTCSVMI